MGKILLVVLLFAGVVYGFFWLLERRRSKTSPARPLTAPKRAVGPDDDEEFLRELERRRRRAARESKPEKPSKPAPGPEAGSEPGPHPGQEEGPADKDGSKPEGPADKGRSKPE